MMKLIESIVNELPTIRDIRRDIHSHPELSFEEVRTADIIAKKLGEWGLPIHRGLAKTGVIGIVKNGTSNRAIGLRADIDALPMQERNTFAHASKHEGKMHACGHDGHIAMLLAAAQYFSRQRDFDGTVYLIFQPAEEFGGGAREMINEGLFELFPMDAVFGMHNLPDLDVGKFTVGPGPICGSSNEVKITIRGRGGHAASPHLTIDPVLIACEMVQSFQTILSRNMKPIDAAVISISMIHAGEATNVVPESCELQGTVRTFTLEVLDLVERRMQRIAEHVCAAHDATCEFEFRRSYPPTINSMKEAAFAHKVMADIVGEDNVALHEPGLGAEDFAFMLQAKPGAYCMIGNGSGYHRASGHGTGPCALHNASYDFNDDLIPLGATYWVRLAENWLAKR